MKKILLSLILCLAAATSAFGQSARIIQLPSGKYIGFFFLPSGESVYLDDVEVVKLPDVPPTVSDIGVVAFVFDNDSPDIRWQGEMQIAIRELRKTIDSVVQIDESPQSVGSIKQGKTIIEAANKISIPAIVILNSQDKVVKSVAMPKTSAEMIKAVKP